LTTTETRAKNSKKLSSNDQTFEQNLKQQQQQQKHLRQQISLNSCLHSKSFALRLVCFELSLDAMNLLLTSGNSCTKIFKHIFTP